MLLSSTQNARIKYLAKLQSKKHRDREERFLVEGYFPLRLALKNGWEVLEVYFCPPLFRPKFDNISLLKQAEKAQIKITEITKEVYFKISSYESPEGLIALVAKKNFSLDDFEPAANSLILAAEGIEKLSNLGALFRLADNAGVNAFFVCDMRADVYNPEVIRSSLGAVFSVNHYIVSNQQALDILTKNDVTIVATSPHGQDYFAAASAYTPSTAIVVGTEYLGLSDFWLQAAHSTVKIPMLGQTESLSIPTSAAIILYEAIKNKN